MSIAARKLSVAILSALALGCIVLLLRLAGLSWMVSCLLGPMLFVALVAVALVLAIKRALLLNWPRDLDLTPAKTEDFPDLDLATIESKCQALHALGFVQLADFTQSSHTGKPTPYFARILANEELGCYAEASQLFPRGRAAHAVGVTMMSVFGPAGATEQRESTFATPATPPLPEPSSPVVPQQGEWTLATTDRAPDGVVWALRSPQRMMTRHPGASPEQLLQKHLALRQEVQRVLAESVHHNLSAADYRARALAHAGRARQRAERLNALRFFYDWKFAGPKQLEWWGELPSRRKQSAAFQVRSDPQ
jgi:hypothetical protein